MLRLTTIAVKIQETDDEDRLAGFAFLFLTVAVFAIADGQALGWGKTARSFRWWLQSRC